MSSSTLLTLPRELRDEILTHLISPSYVYTSSSKPNTENLHRGKLDAPTYVDTRISLPCRPASNILGVCRQLREEGLQHYAHHLNTLSALPALSKLKEEERNDAKSQSYVLAERLGTEIDEEAERINDQCLRITLEIQRNIRGKHGYYLPERKEVSPRFLALLPMVQSVKKLRLVVWPGFDWWNGMRPRTEPDSIAFAIQKVLEHLRPVQDLEIDILCHVGDMSRWDLPDQKWEHVQYWLDLPIPRINMQTTSLKKVTRRMQGVWNSTLAETFYLQEEQRLDEFDEEGQRKWRVKRHGDMRTVSEIRA